METMTDNQIKQWMASSRREVVDNDFTRRVMRQLPRERSYFEREWIGWLCGMIGVLIAYLTGAFTALFAIINQWADFMPSRFDTLISIGVKQIKSGNYHSLTYLLVAVTLLVTWLYEKIISDEA